MLNKRDRKITRIEEEAKSCLGHLGENWIPKFPRIIGTPPIINDEAFSSWAVRICSAYGFTVQKFLRIIGIKKRSHQIDIGYESLDLMRISALVMCDPNLIAHLNWPVDSVLAKPTFSWLSLHGIYEEPIYQYCPKCLKSDSIPYFRQSWRIATNEICPIHSVFLQLNCPHCQKHINLSTYSRLTSTLKKSLLYCNKGGKSLAQGKQKNANSSPHQDKLRKQKEIYGLIKSTSSHWKSKSLSNHAKARVNKCAAEAISKYRDEYIDGDWGELKTPPGIEWLLPSLNDKK